MRLIPIVLMVVVGCGGAADGTDSGGDTDALPPPSATVDVLVIGSGPAGLSAASRVAEAGRSVMVVERQPVAGGSGWYAGRYLAVNTRFQRSIGVDDSVDAALSDWPRLTGGAAPDDHVTQLLSRSAEVVEWIVDDLGVKLIFVGNELGQDPVPRMHAFEAEDRGPVRALLDRLTDRVVYETSATELVIQDGRVIGSRVRDDVAGTESWIAADATIVASGGFARNMEQVLRDRPEFQGVPTLVEIGFPADGGGIALLEGAGAQWQNMGSTGIYAHSIADPDRPGETLWPQRLQEGIFVDLDGNRVANEETMTGFLLVDSLLAAPEHRLFAVLPGSVFLGTALIVPPYNVGFGQPGALPAASLVDRGVIAVYDTRAELAANLGISLSNLDATFERYEAFAASGDDLDFHKEAAGLKSFIGESLVVLELRPGVAKSYSGFATDVGGRVLAANGAPIPGLYGAGEAIGVLGSEGAGRGFSGSITAVYLTGLVAGESAASDLER